MLSGIPTLVDGSHFCCSGLCSKALNVLET